MRKNFLTIIALVAVFAFVFAGCGKQDAAENTTAAPASPTAATSAAIGEAPALGLSDWHLSTTTWSSPNGATVHLTATPISYDDGCSAAFVVRLEGEEVGFQPCQWDGKAYTASVELNAADDLCYYVIMNSPDGKTIEVPVNTPTAPTNEALINMASSLTSYCNLMVETSAFADGKLTITAGSAQVQTPKITNDGDTITVSKAVLALNFDGEEKDSEKLTLTEGETTGLYEMALTDVSFDVPEMENDQQLNLVLNVELSNGQTLTCAGGTFFYNDGELLTAVG